MDSSIRLERLNVVFGAVDKVALSALTAEQAFLIGSEVLGACSGQLTYLAGFLRFGDYLADSLMDDNGCARRLSDEASTMYPLPEGFSGNSFCVPVRTITFKQWGGPKTRRAKRQGYVYRQELLLARTGDLLIWDWFARCERTTHGRREFAIRSKVRMVKGRSVKRLLGNRLNAMAVCSRLGWLVTDTIEERKARLKSIEELNTFIKLVEGRLTV